MLMNNKQAPATIKPSNTNFNQSKMREIEGFEEVFIDDKKRVFSQSEESSIEQAIAE